ncbi:hypothetical protein GA0061093_117126 [Rhodococcus qingshengii]|nr:hypothetical protein GA0061093_117126 [Rhodococcus qingshengii]
MTRAERVPRSRAGAGMDPLSLNLGKVPLNYVTFDPGAGICLVKPTAQSAA